MLRLRVVVAFGGVCVCGVWCIVFVIGVGGIIVVVISVHVMYWYGRVTVISKMRMRYW